MSVAVNNSLTKDDDSVISSLNVNLIVCCDSCFRGKLCLIFSKRFSVVIVSIIPFCHYIFYVGPTTHSRYVVLLSTLRRIDDVRTCKKY